MTDADIIEVWGFDNERPESFIYLKEGSVKTEKDFHYEVMSWCSKNVV
jgi:hypothetical protein